MIFSCHFKGLIDYENHQKDPWINDLIKANTGDHQTLSAQSAVMPKLLIVDTKVFQGIAKSSDIFVNKIEKLFGL